MESTKGKSLTGYGVRDIEVMKASFLRLNGFTVFAARNEASGRQNIDERIFLGLRKRYGVIRWTWPYHEMTNLRQSIIYDERSRNVVLGFVARQKKIDGSP